MLKRPSINGVDRYLSEKCRPSTTPKIAPIKLVVRLWVIREYRACTKRQSYELGSRFESRVHLNATIPFELKLVLLRLISLVPDSFDARFVHLSGRESQLPLRVCLASVGWSIYSD